MYACQLPIVCLVSVDTENSFEAGPCSKNLSIDYSNVSMSSIVVTMVLVDGPLVLFGARLLLVGFGTLNHCLCLVNTHGLEIGLE